MKNLEKLKDELTLNQYVFYFYDEVPHPWDDKTKVVAVAIFANDEKDIRTMVENFKVEGWQVWIIGYMVDVPAAYMYKEGGFI